MVSCWVVTEHGLTAASVKCFIAVYRFLGGLESCDIQATSGAQTPFVILSMKDFKEEESLNM